MIRKREALERVIKLYEAWDAAEPGQGHTERAAEWRAKLQESQVATDSPDDADTADENNGE